MNTIATATPAQGNRATAGRSHYAAYPLVIMFYYRIRPGWAILMLPVFLLLAVLTALGVGCGSQL